MEFENGGAERSELYGMALIERLSGKLRDSGLKGCSPTNLRKFREFYRAYPKIQQTPSVDSIEPPEIQQTPSVDSFLIPTGIAVTVPPAIGDRFPLGWSHYVVLLTIDNPEERGFYEIEAKANSWSVRELERQIAASLYERLALSRAKSEVRRLSSEGQVVEKASDLVKNPLVLEFLDLEERPAYSESDLEAAIIDRLEHFLLELGKGFLFEARQKRFTFDNDYFLVDLVFYNRLLRCYVLIDLKRGKLTHQDLGQMQMYVNYFDRYVKTEEEFPTVGIVLCSRKNDALVELIRDLKRGKLTHQDLGQMQMYVNYFDRYVKTEEEFPTVGIVLCSRKNDALVELTLPKEANIYASKYQLYLPSKQELKAQLENIRQELGDPEGGSYG